MNEYDKICQRSRNHADQSASVDFKQSIARLSISQCKSLLVSLSTFTRSSAASLKSQIVHIEENWKIHTSRRMRWVMVKRKYPVMEIRKWCRSILLEPLERPTEKKHVTVQIMTNKWRFLSITFQIDFSDWLFSDSFSDFFFTKTFSWPPQPYLALESQVWGVILLPKNGSFWHFQLLNFME